jgi:hypothetical protein
MWSHRHIHLHRRRPLNLQFLWLIIISTVRFAPDFFRYRRQRLLSIRNPPDKESPPLKNVFMLRKAHKATPTKLPAKQGRPLRLSPSRTR